MSQQNTILLAVLVAVVGFVLVMTQQPAQAQRGGPYQLMHHSNTTAAAGVFRLDTASGDVSFCYVTSQNEVQCSKSAQ